MYVPEESIAKGRKVREQLTGESGVATPANAGALALAPGLEEWSLGYIFGEIWARPGLDLKTRSLVTMTTHAVMGSHGPLKTQLSIALHLGWTPTEITEAFVQLVAYAGAAKGMGALGVAQELFTERGLTVPDPGKPAGTQDPIERGKEVRIAMGGGPSPRSATTAPIYELMPDLEDFLIGGIFGAIWGRPGLEQRFRNVVVITALAVMSRETEMRGHLGYSLNLGWTPQQVAEMYLHLMPYAGAPITIGALRVAQSVFKEKGAI